MILLSTLKPLSFLANINNGLLTFRGWYNRIRAECSMAPELVAVRIQEPMQLEETLDKHVRFVFNKIADEKPALLYRQYKEGGALDQGYMQMRNDCLDLYEDTYQQSDVHPPSSTLTPEEWFSTIPPGTWMITVNDLPTHDMLVSRVAPPVVFIIVPAPQLPVDAPPAPVQRLSRKASKKSNSTKPE